MLAGRKVCGLVIFLSIHSDGRQFAKPQATNRPKLTSTSVILVLDFSYEFGQSDFDSMKQLYFKLFNAFKSDNALFSMCPLIIDRLDYTCRAWYRDPNLITKWLKNPFYTMSKWDPLKRRNRFYAAAFNSSSHSFKKFHYPYFGSGYKKVMLLITHGSEMCKIEECLNSYGCCHENCRACYKNKGQKGCQANLTRNNITEGETDGFVTGEADQLKKDGVTVITVGVGQWINATRLTCWASPQMYIQLTDYSQLPHKGAKEMLDLLSGRIPQPRLPKFSSRTHAVLTVPTTSKMAPASGAVAAVTTTLDTVSSSSKFNLLVKSTTAVAPVNIVNTEGKTYAVSPDGDSVEWIWSWRGLVAIAVILVVLIIFILVIVGLVLWGKRRQRNTVLLVQPRDGARYPHRCFPGTGASIGSTPRRTQNRQPGFIRSIGAAFRPVAARREGRCPYCDSGQKHTTTQPNRERANPPEATRNVRICTTRTRQDKRHWCESKVIKQTERKYKTYDVVAHKVPQSVYVGVKK